MTIIALLPALVAIAGALIYGLSSNAKFAEMGRIALFCGLLAFMFAMSSHHIQIGGH